MISAQPGSASRQGDGVRRARVPDAYRRRAGPGRWRTGEDAARVQARCGRAAGIRNALLSLDPQEDIAAICQWLLEQPASRGAYNAGSPNPVTNAEFTRALGRALGRPTVFPMPQSALKLLFGEMSELLLVSDRMLPKRLLEEGFVFAIRAGGALKAILRR